MSRSATCTQAMPMMGKDEIIINMKRERMARVGINTLLTMATRARTKRINTWQWETVTIRTDVATAPRRRTARRTRTTIRTIYHV